jgi:hypothetical protein
MLTVFIPRNGFDSPGRGPTGGGPGDGGSGARDEAKLILDAPGDGPSRPLGAVGLGLVGGGPSGGGNGGREPVNEGGGMNDVGGAGREPLSVANDQPDGGFDGALAGNSVAGLGRGGGSGFGSGVWPGRGVSGPLMAATRFFSLCRVIRMATTPANTHNRIKITDTPILVSLPMVNLLVDAKKVSGTVSSTDSAASSPNPSWPSSSPKRFLKPFSWLSSSPKRFLKPFSWPSSSPKRFLEAFSLADILLSPGRHAELGAPGAGISGQLFRPGGNGFLG